MRSVASAKIPMRTAAGTAAGYLVITRQRTTNATHGTAIYETEESEGLVARYQLRESESYRYQLIDPIAANLRIRCALSQSDYRPADLLRSEDCGTIETRSFCGTLTVDLVSELPDKTDRTIASVRIEVRPRKLAYWSEYRGMVGRVFREVAGLVADARSPAKASMLPHHDGKADSGWLHLQLEYLREEIENTGLCNALSQIIAYPHTKLSNDARIATTDRLAKLDYATARKLIEGNPRQSIPSTHHLQKHQGITSVATTLSLRSKKPDVDTTENRFVKYVLHELRIFLSTCCVIFESTAGWEATAQLSRRLLTNVDAWLQREFFKDVADLESVWIGSPVLQRKPGYREVLQLWLRMKSTSALTWDGSADLFMSGQRDTARLYEYWLFFILLEWFTKKCRDGKPPPVGMLIENIESGRPNVRLRKGKELGPIRGTYRGAGRDLNAAFSYNRRFPASRSESIPGTWTRSLHPDYTLSFWPATLTEAQAEKFELMVHVHFDAKYRAESIEGLYGEENAEDVDEEIDGNYKRPDLLKMHAYRDGIRRSQGAYVLYPGLARSVSVYNYSHEVLPGLGALSLRPDEHGAAVGEELLHDFLDKMLRHLSNRVTAQERVSYHTAEAYAVKDEGPAYGSMRLPELDNLRKNARALPPSEHYVIVAVCDSVSQYELIAAKGIVVVHVGSGVDGWCAPPEMVNARHVLLRNSNGVAHDGLLRLTRPGFIVCSSDSLLLQDYPDVKPNQIYAVFYVTVDVIYSGCRWNREILDRQIESFWSARRYVGRVDDSIKKATPQTIALSNLLLTLM